MHKRVILFFIATVTAAQLVLAQVRIRHPRQAIDEEYTNKIREYTTEPFFNAPWTDYLPASKTVPTPKVVLGDIAGAPNKLPYSADVYLHAHARKPQVGLRRFISMTARMRSASGPFGPGFPLRLTKRAADIFGALKHDETARGWTV